MMVEMKSMPIITVVVPCRNEEAFIAEVIRDILRQKGAGKDFKQEIKIVDGMSTDRTREIVEGMAKENPAVRVIVNERKITPVAFNLGISDASGGYICILGAHWEIPDDYFLNCLAALERTGADNVGGACLAKGSGYVGNAIALAFQSRFAVGGSSHHIPEHEGWVDTVPGGFYRREVFDKIGLFDEELVRNQDDELNLRLARSGGRIWQSGRLSVTYHCRNRLSQLWQQYLQYGYWKVRVIQKHKLPASIRHLVPAGFILSLAGLAVFALFNPFAFILLAALLGIYLAGLIFASVAACRIRTAYLFPIMPLVFAAYHFAYGMGFLLGVRDFVIFKGKNSRVSFQAISR